MSEQLITGNGTSARELAKDQRRQRILNAAKDTLRELGHEQLSIRTLAARAGVTTPTIYNLVGNKQDILLALSKETILELEKAHHISTTVDPIEKAEDVINGTVAIYQKDEVYTRQLQLGLEVESLNDFEGDLRERGRKVAIEDCKRACELGYLNGDIDSELLGNRFATGFQHAQREWLRGQVDLEGMRKDALISCFIILASDAKPKFRKRLFASIRHLQDGK